MYSMLDCIGDDSSPFFPHTVCGVYAGETKHVGLLAQIKNSVVPRLILNSYTTLLTTE